MDENIKDVLNTAVESASSYGSADSGELTGTLLEKWFMPGNVEQRQFGQQIALQQMQNEWNSEGQKMKRMIDAGINPLTAAAGVSQSGQSGATGLTPQQTEGVSAGEAAQGLQAAGDVVDKLSSAKERDTLLNERRKNLINDTYLKWVTAGKTDLESKSLAIALAYLPVEKYLGILTLQQNMANLRAQHKQILQQVEESKKRIEQIDADIELAHAQCDYTKELQLKAEKEKELIISQTTEQNWLNGVRKEYGIDPRSPIENNVLMTGLKGGKDYDTTLGIIHDTEYNRATGSYEAEEQHAFGIAYDKARGDALASWLSRPNSVAAAVVQVGVDIGSALRAGRMSREQALEQVRVNKQLHDGFEDCKTFLLKSMQDANHNYRKISSKYGRNSNEARNALYEKKKATALYYNFDEDDYLDILMNQAPNDDKK